MTPDPIKKQLSDLDIAIPKTETEPESNVALLKTGLLVLIFLGIGMLIVTAWFMTNRYWR